MMKPLACVRFSIASCMVATLAIVFAFAGHAADARHCADIAGLKRFDGSSIVICEARSFAEYLLPTGKSLAYDFDTRRAVFEAALKLEGRLTQNVYAVPKGASAAEVFRNYAAALAAKGYAVLFQAQQAELGENLGSYFENTGPGTQIWGYSPNEARYLAAVKDADGTRTYVALYVIEYEDGYDRRFSPAKGQVMVRLDAVEVGALTDRMTVASAAEISARLASSGRAVLRGLLFDFDSATIRPESQPALDEIGKFLTGNPTQNVYIIGHTDNVGGFDFNMRLSWARAEAVVAALARSHGIAPGRMIAGGVGLQAPVASNETEEGRAQNRRVELVPR
jgi:outer membrane protein OmpA-like peptidoglycan-associated protein